jgi:hypothetical protein
MKKLFFPSLIFLTILGGLLSVGALAANPPAPGPLPPPPATTLPNPLNTTGTIFDLVKKVVDWLVTTLAPIIATVMVIIGAFQMILAKGDPKLFDTGRKTVLYTVIGYAILLLGSVITTIVSDFLNVK